MSKQGQSGFSIIEIVIVLVIIGIVGFFGWRIWQDQTKKETPKVTYATYNKTLVNKDAEGTLYFRYPSTWKITDGLDIDTANGSSSEVIVSRIKQPTTGSLKIDKNKVALGLTITLQPQSVVEESHDGGVGLPRKLSSFEKALETIKINGKSYSLVGSIGVRKQVISVEVMECSATGLCTPDIKRPAGNYVSFSITRFAGISQSPEEGSPINFASNDYIELKKTLQSLTF